jgi:hypothetical protein
MYRVPGTCICGALLLFATAHRNTSIVFLFSISYTGTTHWFTPRYDASLVHCNCTTVTHVVYTHTHHCNSVTLFTLLKSGILKPGVGIVGTVKIVQQQYKKCSFLSNKCITGYHHAQHVLQLICRSNVEGIGALVWWWDG